MAAVSLWKCVGFAGTALFASRWGIQFWASRRAGRSVVPLTFWLASFLGSMTLVAYFTLGPHRDLVGVMGNAFPAAVSGYNLFLITRRRGPAPELLTGPAASTATIPPGTRTS
jgi:lipid-A-disaccharide synthase-like uncharacterized protein